MIFDSWAGIGRVLLVGTLAYVALVVVLRISGKRTLTKLNAFDLVQYLLDRGADDLLDLAR